MKHRNLLFLCIALLFSGCSTMEKEILSSEISHGVSITEETVVSEEHLEDAGDKESVIAPWLSISPIKSDGEQIWLGEDEWYSRNGMLVGDYWLSPRWNCAEEWEYDVESTVIHSVFPQDYYDGISYIGCLLGKDYLVGFREPYNESERSKAREENRPASFPQIECFIFTDGEFRSFPVEIWSQLFAFCDSELDFSYDEVKNTVTISSAVMTAQVQMETGETTINFSTERIRKNEVSSIYSIYNLFETEDKKYELNAVSLSMSEYIYFSRNTETGEEYYIAHGYIRASSALIVWLMQEENKRIKNDSINIEGHTVFFSDWGLAFDLETGKQVI